MENDGTVYIFRKFFTKYVYRIGEDGLEMSHSNAFDKQETVFSYDVIPVQPTFSTTWSRAAFWLMIVFSLFFAIILIAAFTGQDHERAAYFIWGIPAVASALWYIRSRQRSLLFQGQDGSFLYLLFSTRHYDEMKAFVSAIEQAKLKYQEAKIKYYLPTIGQNGVYGRLMDLRERQIIDNKGYEYLIKKTDELSSPQITGFQKRNA